jgi:hypothetical protein
MIESFDFITITLQLVGIAIQIVIWYYSKR